MAKSLILYETEMGVLLSLNDEQRGRIVGAIIRDLTGKEPAELDGVDSALFTLINAQVQRAAALSDKRRQSRQSALNRDSESTSAPKRTAKAQQSITNAEQSLTNPEQNLTTDEHHNNNHNHNNNLNDNPDQNENQNDNNNPSPLAPRGGKRERVDSETIESFEKFWEKYPRKTSKPQALKAWQSLKPDNELLEVILSAIEKQKRSEQWTRDNGRYIPYPATWLNNKRWEDELKPADDFGMTERLNRTKEEWLGGFATHW